MVNNHTLYAMFFIQRVHVVNNAALNYIPLKATFFFFIFLFYFFLFFFFTYICYIYHTQCSLGSSTKCLVINSVSESSFSFIYSQHHKFWESVHPTPCIMCHVAPVTCYLSCVTSHIYFFLYNLKKKLLNIKKGGIIHNVNTLYEKYCIQRLIILRVVISIAYNVWVI